MSFDRRRLLKLSAAIAAGFVALPAGAKGRKLKVLMLGGTGFIGPHFVHALTGAGHTVTLFNRGKRDPDAKQGVEQLLGDRNDNLKALEGRDWDVVIDNSGYTPGQVKLSTALLKGHVKQYIFISSIAVYDDFQNPPILENHKLTSIGDMPQDKLADGNYGALKVLCEKVVHDAFGKSANIIRPTYIAGPGDVSDRFTYWPFRVSRGGEMIAPGTPDDPIQYIDVRDLADFVALCAGRGTAGVFNLCTPPRFATMGKLLETSRKVTGADTKFVWASTQFLMENKAIEDGMWASQEIPIWAPPSGQSLGHGLVSSAAAEKKGLKFRSLETTVRETLAWQKGRPEEKQKLRSGFGEDREKELLARLRA
ncbi:MAG TPA: SDR family oxidoreductase [Steroidobacteraceae bacterium]|nr:SDR family oxidoreductase [Steroidobacteraceae bacterium]